MKDHRPKSPWRAFWTSLPGVLTGVAGLIAAVTGLVLALDGGTNDTTTTTETTTTTTTETTTTTTEAGPATILGESYNLREWRERTPPADSPIVLGMGVRSGTLLIDEFGHAVWELELDSGMAEQFTPGVRCLGIVDEAAELLAGVTGELDVAGETLKGEQRDWNLNLLSLEEDALVAWCGHTYFSQGELFVYERRRDDYILSLRAIDADTSVLSMENVAGTFTWEKE